MKLHRHVCIAAKLLLLASLLAINVAPFLLNTRNQYEIVFLILSAIHGEVCLTVAWLLFAATIRPWQGWVWSGLVFASAFVAAKGLLVGRTGDEGNLVTAIAILPSLAICLGFFAISSRLSSIRLVTGTNSARGLKQFQLKDLIAIVAGAAYLSFLVRLLLTSEREGWLYDNKLTLEITLLFGVQSATLGLLLAPLSRILLKPTCRGLWYLVYAAVICAVEPIAQQLLIFRGRLGAFVWSDSYVPIVFDNIAWYGPQLLPTAVLIALLRLSGVQVEEKK